MATLSTGSKTPSKQVKQQHICTCTTVVKEVPVERIVEKEVHIYVPHEVRVEVPIEHIIEKEIQVPIIMEKIVEHEVPVEVFIDRIRTVVLTDWTSVAIASVSFLIIGIILGRL